MDLFNAKYLARKALGMHSPNTSSTTAIIPVIIKHNNAFFRRARSGAERAGNFDSGAAASEGQVHETFPALESRPPTAVSYSPDTRPLFLHTT